MERFEYEMECVAKKAGTAINRFFKKYPQLNYWREMLEYMADEQVETVDDTIFADGSRNSDWCYALHFENFDDHFYICVIERR